MVSVRSETNILAPLDARVRNEDSVSAGAKIPIMPVEKSPPPYVVNRSLLRTEEVPRLVKGERRARDQRTATARDEHPRDQPVDRLGSQNHSQLPARTRWSAGGWAAPGTGQRSEERRVGKERRAQRAHETGA